MDFYICLETENFLLEIYPSIFTALGLLITLGLTIYTVNHMLIDIKKIVNKLKERIVKRKETKKQKEENKKLERRVRVKLEN